MHKNNNKVAFRKSHKRSIQAIKGYDLCLTTSSLPVLF